MRSLIIISTIFLSVGMTHQIEARHHDPLPYGVEVSLSNRYHHFDLIHVESVFRRGRQVFNLLIQHGNSYLEVTIGNRGRVFRETRHRHYPLADHYCDNYCGFHYQHYENGHFASYDPYIGCHAHSDLMFDRHHRDVYRPYYGYGYVHYNPRLRIYKRFRPYHIPASGYQVHRGKKYHRRGYGHDYGKHHRKHKYRRHEDHHRANQRYYRQGRHRG